MFKEEEQVWNSDLKFKSSWVIDSHICLAEIAPVASIPSYFLIEYKPLSRYIVVLFWLNFFISPALPRSLLSEFSFVVVVDNIGEFFGIGARSFLVSNLDFLWDK